MGIIASQGRKPVISWHPVQDILNSLSHFVV